MLTAPRNPANMTVPTKPTPAPPAPSTFKSISDDGEDGTGPATMRFVPRASLARLKMKEFVDDIPMPALTLRDPGAALAAADLPMSPISPPTPQRVAEAAAKPPVPTFAGPRPVLPRAQDSERHDDWRSVSTGYLSPRDATATDGPANVQSAPAPAKATKASKSPSVKKKKGPQP
jgi:hypothetical protein